MPSDDPAVEKHKGFEVDLEAALGQAYHLFHVQAVFIVAANGIFSFACADLDHKARLDPEVFLAEAKSPLDARQDAEGK